MPLYVILCNPAESSQTEYEREVRRSALDKIEARLFMPNAWVVSFRSAEDLRVIVGPIFEPDQLLIARITDDRHEHRLPFALGSIVH